MLKSLKVILSLSLFVLLTSCSPTTNFIVSVSTDIVNTSIENITNFANQMLPGKYEKLAKKLSPTVSRICVTGTISLWVVHMSTTTPNTFIQEQIITTRTISGTGVFISSAGEILTCKHLFDNFIEILNIDISLYDGSTITGNLVKVSSSDDLALVKALPSMKYSFAKLAKSTQLRIGQEVITIGFPLGFMWTFTNGIISGLYEDVAGRNSIQTNVVINSGSSGSPLFNMKGEVVGINVEIVTTSPFVTSWCGHGFAVSINRIYQFLFEIGYKQ